MNKVSASDLISQVQINLKTLIDDKKAKISYSNLTNSDYIISSEIALSLILQNLVQNGIKYNNHTPVIDISLIKKGDNLSFVVKDNGIGISKEYSDYIFLPFKTLDSKSKTGSSGLGLAICSQLASKIHGEISMDSKINNGSTFTLSFKDETKYLK